MTETMRKLYSDQEAVQFLLDAARALEYLHLKEPAIIHRDIKCENILLTRGMDNDGRPGRWQAKISDLGLHRVGAADCQHQLKHRTYTYQQVMQ